MRIKDPNIDEIKLIMNQIRICYHEFGKALDKLHWKLKSMEKENERN